MSNDDNTAAFVTAIRAGGAERERAFAFFEARLAPSFGNGEEGYESYRELLAIVKQADPSAAKEYEGRFAKLLDVEVLKKNALKIYAAALEEEVKEKRTEILSQGGEPAIKLFLEEAMECASTEDGGLKEWIDFAIPTLPEFERHMIVELLVKAVRAK